MESFGPVETMHSMFILLWTKQTNVDLASGSDCSTSNASVLFLSSSVKPFCTHSCKFGANERIVPTNTRRFNYMFSILHFCFESPCCIWGPHVPHVWDDMPRKRVHNCLLANVPQVHCKACESAVTGVRWAGCRLPCYSQQEVIDIGILCDIVFCWIRPRCCRTTSPNPFCNPPFCRLWRFIQLSQLKLRGIGRMSMKRTRALHLSMFGVFGSLSPIVVFFGWWAPVVYTGHQLQMMR